MTCDQLKIWFCFHSKIWTSVKIQLDWNLFVFQNSAFCLPKISTFKKKSCNCLAFWIYAGRFIDAYFTDILFILTHSRLLTSRRKKCEISLLLKSCDSLKIKLYLAYNSKNGINQKFGLVFSPKSGFQKIIWPYWNLFVFQNSHFCPQKCSTFIYFSCIDLNETLFIATNFSIYNYQLWLNSRHGYNY